MSEQGAGATPGWYADPHGRHDHRYWDGRAWTDQVSDAGTASTDPVAAAPTTPATGATPSYAAEPAPGEGRKVPVGVLALVGVVVAAIVVAVVLLVTGGDDGGGETADTGGDASAGSDDTGDEAGGTGTFEGSLSEDEPVATYPVTLAAGDALRVVVEPSDDLDTAVSVAVEDGALTEGFAGLLAPGGDQDQIDERILRQTIIVAQETLDEDTADALVTAYDSDFLPDGFLDQVIDAIGEEVPELGEAGSLFFGTDRSSGGEPEGVQLVAPAAGTYTVVVTGHNRSEGDFDVTLEVEPGDDAALGEDEIDYLDYLATYGEHVDFFCDEGFFGGDPEDVTAYGPTICDPDTLDGVLTGELNGDFTNDFGGGDAFSDFSDDFSDDGDDATSDFSDDFSEDFSSDFSDVPTTPTLGSPVAPAQFIDEHGTVPRFDRMARRCFVGNLELCDQLYAVTPVSASTNSYEGYGATCGGRLTVEAPGTCASYG